MHFQYGVLDALNAMEPAHAQSAGPSTKEKHQVLLGLRLELLIEKLTD